MTGVKRAAFGSAILAAAWAFGAASAARADIIQWSDTSAGIRYGVDHREPANPNDITKAIIQLQHVHGWTYGQTFIGIDILKGVDEDEEAADDGNGPATEIYAVLREKLSSAKIFGAAYGGPIRDIGLTIGGDISYDDDAFHGRVRKFVVGPKGTDGFGNDTVYEILLESALMFDVGTLIGAPDALQIGLGYQWWRNKYGNDPEITTFGTEASVPQFVAEFHF